MRSFPRYVSTVLAVPVFSSGAAAVTLGYPVLGIAFIVTLVPAVLIGLPLAAILVSRGWMNAPVAVLAGFVAGVVIVGVLVLMATYDAGWGLIGYDAEMIAMAGLYGAAGGLGAWIMWRVSAGAPWLGLGAAVAVSALIVAMPWLTKDRSCHNMFRDTAIFGVHIIEPRLIANLDLSPKEWPVLTRLFRDFAEAEGWSLREASPERPARLLSSKPRYALSVCREDGTLITADPYGDDTARILVWQPRGGPGWKAPAQKLLRRVDARWPGRLRLEGGNGVGPVDKDEFLDTDANPSP